MAKPYLNVEKHSKNRNNSIDVAIVEPLYTDGQIIGAKVVVILGQE